MSISEKLSKAMDELGSAADEAIDTAKAKYKETMTPEKKQELKEKFDKGMQNADETLTGLAHDIGSELKSTFGSGTNKN